MNETCSATDRNQMCKDCQDGFLGLSISDLRLFLKSEGLTEAGRKQIEDEIERRIQGK